MEPAEENYHRFMKALEVSARLTLKLIDHGYQDLKKELAEIKAAREPEKELTQRLAEALKRAENQISIAYMQRGISAEDRDSLLKMAKDMTKHSSIDDGCVKLASLKGLTKDFEELNRKHLIADDPYPKDLAKDAEKLRHINAESIAAPDKFVKDMAKGDIFKERMMRASMDRPLKEIQEAAAKELQKLLNPKRDMGLDKVK